MANRTILVIDDSMVIRRTVKDMLPPGKFDVVEAKDGLQGMELLKTTKPQIIMLDFFLPKMSGWDVYQEIQKNPHFRAIPLLLMSGRKDEVTDKIPEPFEYFAFLEKPFDQKQLVQGIRDSMERSKKLAQVLQQSVPQKSATATSSGDDADTAQLNARVAHLEAEVDKLKKQINQLVGFIKKKLS
ncbi:response regulator [Cyanobacterium sp. IPPAS B-1200]|uniref:response regulator n=1 Tax=Cyanobacterium sp. IPPAS B-1200 TaxID=1562720 RepID=UPI0008526C5E|nr:response regulator [Cyanobacterium sp. IPPAS B-1200]OEJ78077.1 two-component system response regulator [Cyanobacterium sp. IPPAS B-1200]